MTHAAYAHRGAYPLVVTALLAAGFVLIAMRPAGPAESSKLIRPLVLAWIAQNVALVVSSILRLDLYVGVYSLTYLRLAAFIWMGLVAVGLILIIIQILRRKPNSWLVNMNASALVLTLYASCFLNFPYVIATYNVTHSAELDGNGPKLDQDYLWSLGPAAIPAIDIYNQHVPTQWPRHLSHSRRGLAREASTENWRGWSFRAWRLNRYLAKHSDNAPPVTVGAAPQSQP
jgi:hypothetical protein